MRLSRQLLSLGRVIPLLLGWALAQSGCQGDTQQFYTYCDNTGCYQCDASGCGRLQGLPPGTACKNASECAPGCYCSAAGKCAEAGFCDRQTDCAQGYVCNVARHSCEPASSGGGGGKPQACKLAADCAAGAECNNGQCAPTPVPANHCVFNRQCGAGGVCQDGLCQPACTDDAACGTGRSCQSGRCQPKDPGAGACLSSSQCGVGQTCIDGTCHLSCTKDGDCQAGSAADVCTSGVCRPNTARVPECKTNAGCATGTECVDAQCRTFCLASSDCALCSDGGTVCQGGYCVSPREAAPQCRLAGDCGGTHCTDGGCAK